MKVENEVTTMKIELMLPSWYLEISPAFQRQQMQNFCVHIFVNLRSGHQLSISSSALRSLLALPLSTEMLSRNN